MVHNYLVPSWYIQLTIYLKFSEDGDICKWNISKVECKVENAGNLVVTVCQHWINIRAKLFVNNMQDFSLSSSFPPIVGFHLVKMPAASRKYFQIPLEMDKFCCSKPLSAISYQIFIFPPHDSPSKTIKIVFYFIKKALFILEIFKFFPFLSTLSKFK